MPKHALLASIAVLLLAGCASIVSNSSYDVRLTSTPDSNYTIENHNGLEVGSGQTPDVVRLSASSGFFSGARYVIRFEASGYQPRTVQLSSTVDGWVIGNILLGGPIGLVIDGATGAMFKLDSPPRQRLRQNQANSGSDELTIVFFDYNDLTEQQKESLVEIR